MEKIKIMERDEIYAKRIENECTAGDAEVNHVKADDLLIELLKEIGFHRTVKAFENVEKWYA